MSKERTRLVRSRRTRRVVVGAATALVLVGGGFAVANAATAGSDKSAAGVQRPVDKQAKGTAAVVSAANAFLNTLTSDQQASTLLDFSQANATAWSNLPCGGTCRPGIQLSTLSDDQLAAAKALLKTALGTGKDTGYAHVLQTLKADDVLASAESTSSASAAPTDAPTATDSATPTDSASATATDSASAAPTDVPTGAPPSGGAGGGGGFSYGSGYYYLALLGTPSKTGTWQLHFGGHHLAVNITYKDGKVSGASPYFTGVEPTSWTADDGTTYAPLAKFRNGLLKLTGSLSTAQLAEAKLSESFSDVLLGPGKDGDFPETKEGIKVSELSPKQKKLVLAAIHPWIADVDDATAAQLMKTYAKELDQTYVAYSGGTGLDTQGDYVRIDGPGVWVEFVVQNGIVFQNQVHYHTVYRDHTRDYGNEFSFS
ncbi:DUF3500 domain-containing protein [Streptomyces hyaluromycini]|uniref:DUF3500 domain-containing protein n=1 Tax=Streptomyces hyaluromycini TaxID=1377993 RepID=UPI001FE27BA1|nr:DUF3500 domain-containing protein [Streptomyces hyaluromycini]